MLITYEATLLEKIKLTEDVFLLKFSYPTDTDPEWNFKAGQYMIFHLQALENGHPARRLYSIASTPVQKKSLDFIIEIVPNGLGSEVVKKMQPGDKLTMQGPAGIFTVKSPERPIVFLATGTGIAPIYSMIKDCLNSKFEIRNSKIFLYWGLKYKKDVYLKNELDNLAEKNPNFQYSICLSREESVKDTHCLKGRVTKGLMLLATNYQLLTTNFDFYICGGPHVVESLKEYLLAQGVDKKQIFSEKFA